MIFKPDIDELNRAVDKRIAVLAQVAQVGVLPLQILEELRSWVRQVRKGQLSIRGEIGVRYRSSLGGVALRSGLVISAGNM